MDKLKLKILGLETNGCAVKFGLGNYYTKDYLTVYFKFDAMLYSLIDDNKFSLFVTGKGIFNGLLNYFIFKSKNTKYIVKLEQNSKRLIRQKSNKYIRRSKKRIELFSLNKR